MSSENSIKLMIADDQILIRQGLASLLSLNDDIEVVGQASNGLDAIALASELKPDVILMDIRMPGSDGVEATKKILSENPSIKILILTTFEEDAYILESLRAGASGYVLKNIEPQQLADSIRSVYRGIAQLDPVVLTRIIKRAADSRPGSEARKRPSESLTERELDVLNLISKGKSNREIAEALIISEGTVKTHLTSVLGKLNLRDRTQAAIWALENLD